MTDRFRSLQKQLVIIALIFTALALEPTDATSFHPQSPKPSGNDRSSGILSLKNRVEVFEDVWKTINDKYYDPSFNGVDWKGVHDRNRLRIETAKNDEEFYDIIAEMLAGLNDSHTHFDKPPKRSEKSFDHNVGISVYEIEGKFVVSHVEAGSEAAGTGVKQGMIVRTVDGKEVEEHLRWLKPLIRKDVSLSSERSFQFVLHQVFFLGASGTQANIGLDDPEGKPVNVTVTRRKGTFNATPTLHSRRLASGYGYIKFNRWLPPNEKRFKEELQKMMDAPGLIIDLRGNIGGQKEEILTIAGNFFPPHTPLGSDVGRSGEDQGFPPQKVERIYKGAVVILVDEGTGSASEVFTSFMQESGRATVIGRQTSGDVLRADYKKVKGGGGFSYSTHYYRSIKGRKLEGVGITPDKIVPVTLSDLRQQRDADLEEAEKVLRALQQTPKEDELACLRALDGISRLT